MVSTVSFTHSGNGHFPNINNQDFQPLLILTFSEWEKTPAEMTSLLYGGSPRCGRVKSWVLEGYEEERCNSLWHAGPVNICTPMDLKLSSAAVAFSIGIPSVRLQQNVEVTDLKGTSCLCMVTLIPWWREQRRCVPYATSLNWHWMGWDASQLVRTKRVSKCHVGLFIPRCPGHGQLCKFCSPISLSFSQ